MRKLPYLVQFILIAWANVAYGWSADIWPATNHLRTTTPYIASNVLVVTETIDWIITSNTNYIPPVYLDFGTGNQLYGGYTSGVHRFSQRAVRHMLPWASDYMDYKPAYSATDGETNNFIAASYITGITVTVRRVTAWSEATQNIQLQAREAWIYELYRAMTERMYAILPGIAGDWASTLTGVRPDFMRGPYDFLPVLRQWCDDYARAFIATNTPEEQVNDAAMALLEDQYTVPEPCHTNTEPFAYYAGLADLLSSAGLAHSNYFETGTIDLHRLAEDCDAARALLNNMVWTGLSGAITGQTTYGQARNVACTTFWIAATNSPDDATTEFMSGITVGGPAHSTQSVWRGVAGSGVTLHTPMTTADLVGGAYYWHHRPDPYPTEWELQVMGKYEMAGTLRQVESLEFYAGYAMRPRVVVWAGTTDLPANPLPGGAWVEPCGGWAQYGYHSTYMSKTCGVFNAMTRAVVTPERHAESCLLLDADVWGQVSASLGALVRLQACIGEGTDYPWYPFIFANKEEIPAWVKEAASPDGECPVGFLEEIASAVGVSDTRITYLYYAGMMQWDTPNGFVHYGDPR